MQAVIRIAGLLVPRHRRTQWLDQWKAEAVYFFRNREENRKALPRSSRRALGWLSGAFAHALYLFWREYTVDLVWQDIKYGLRALYRGRGLTIVAVMTLAIGIAANATIFSVVDLFMLRPLPYPESDRLYAIWGTNSERGWSQVSISTADFLGLRDHSTGLRVAAEYSTDFNLSIDDLPERVTGNIVTWDFFSILGVQPLHGRGFTPEEERAGQSNVAVISHNLWQRHFAEDSDVLGKTLRLNGIPHIIVGVMPPGFWYQEPGRDIWTPPGFTGEEGRQSHYLRLLARLNDGVSFDQARQEADGIVARMAEEYPDVDAGTGINIISLHRDVFDEGYRSGCLIASVAVLFLLLIACGNVANMLLTQAVGREREVALRGALGAGRSRLFRQFLTESGLVAAMGGVLGLVLAVVGMKAFIAITPPGFPLVDEIGLNPRVVLFTVGISLLTGIIFGLAPALHGMRGNIISSLKDHGFGGEPRRIPRMRRVLVISEISLALALLVASALLAQGFWQLRYADLDFDRSDVLTFRTTIPEVSYPDLDATDTFYDNFVTRLGSLPGVDAVGAVTILPSKENAATYYSLPDDLIEADQQQQVTNYRIVLPGFFEAMDIPMVHGRDFTDDDRRGMPLSLVINESMARRHWPDGNPVGQEIVLSSESWIVIGVAADSRDGPLDDITRPKIYLSARQVEARSLAWVVETAVYSTPMVADIRAELAMIDPDLPLYDVMTMDEAIDNSLGGDLIMAKILAVVAGIALLLCLGGVYGVMAFGVSQRNRELGIRMALGARSSDMMRMVVRQGVRISLIGIVIGMILALAVSNGLTHFLWGVSPFDPLTFGTVAVILFSTALAATFFPARRASKADPMIALRSE
ncbi:ABC transporter permease [Gemmatimonadota bacterium]